MNLMNIAELNEALSGTPFAGKLHHFATIASTNTHAMREATAGAPTWSVYLADQQTAGRGRGAHAWHSEPGNGLYASIVLRPNLSAQDALWLSLAAGLAAHHAVGRATGATPDLRWPNDLMIAENGVSKKFGGILAETQTDGDRLRHAVIGIGINVNHTEFPPDIAGVATSLYRATGHLQSHEMILAALLRALHREVQSLEATLPRGADILRRIETASSWIRGKRVIVTDNDDPANTFAGTTAGLDTRGFLLVNTPAGERTVVSGGVREQ